MQFQELATRWSAPYIFFVELDSFAALDVNGSLVIVLYGKALMPSQPLKYEGHNILVHPNMLKHSGHIAIFNRERRRAQPFTEMAPSTETYCFSN